jgi:hypothetical protein
VHKIHAIKLTLLALTYMKRSKNTKLTKISTLSGEPARQSDDYSPCLYKYESSPCHCLATKTTQDKAPTTTSFRCIAHIWMHKVRRWRRLLSIQTPNTEVIVYSVTSVQFPHGCNTAGPQYALLPPYCVSSRFAKPRPGYLRISRTAPYWQVRTSVHDVFRLCDTGSCYYITVHHAYY